MKLPWILAGFGLGLAAILVLNAPTPEYATGSSDVEDAAQGASAWGVRKRVAGTGQTLVGKAKQAVGDIAGDDGLSGEGVLDQATGAVKDTAGQVAEAAGQTLHDLNG